MKFMGVNKKIKLKKIGMSPWRHILYESINCEWYCKFSYSPISAIDLSM